MARLLTALLVLSACTTEPASIKVKLPGASAQSKKETPPPLLRKKGEKLELRAVAFNAKEMHMGAATVTWSSSDPAVVAVNEQGVAEIVGTGEAQVIATGVGYTKELRDAITLKARIVDTVKIVPPPGFKGVRLGQQVKLAAEVKDEKGQPVSDARVFWSNPDHGCWVQPDGTVSGAAIGPATVIAESEGKVAQLSFEVLDRR